MTRRRFAWVPGPELVAAGTLLVGAVAALGTTATAPSPRLQVTTTVSNVQATGASPGTTAAGRGLLPDAAGVVRSASTGEARVLPSGGGPGRIEAGPGNADVDIHSGGSRVTVGNAGEASAAGFGTEGRTEVTVDCSGGTWGKACEALLLVPGTRRSD